MLKITKIRTTPVLVSYPPQKKTRKKNRYSIPQNGGFIFTVWVMNPYRTYLPNVTYLPTPECYLVELDTYISLHT